MSLSFSLGSSPHNACDNADDTAWCCTGGDSVSRNDHLCSFG